MSTNHVRSFERKCIYKKIPRVCVKVTLDKVYVNIEFINVPTINMILCTIKITTTYTELKRQKEK